MRKCSLINRKDRYTTMIFSGKQIHDSYDSEENYTTRWIFRDNHYRKPKDIADNKMYTVTFRTGKVAGVERFDGCRMTVARYEETPQHIIKKVMAKDSDGILTYIMDFHKETMRMIEKQ